MVTVTVAMELGAIVVILSAYKMAATVINLRCILSSRTVELHLFGGLSLLASIGMTYAYLLCSKEPMRTAIKKPFDPKEPALSVFII